MGKVTLGIGFAAGYVLGAQAGRERYEQIRRQAMQLIDRPEVQQATQKVKDVATDTLQQAGLRSSSGNATTPDATAAASSTVPPTAASGTASDLGQARLAAGMPDPVVPLVDTPVSGDDLALGRPLTDAPGVAPQDLVVDIDPAPDPQQRPEA
jgi:hypothetical protein